MAPGIKGWQTADHWTVIRVHYTADPEVDEQWVKDRSLGYRGGMEGRDWQREMEIDFSSYAGEPVYPRFTTASVKPTAYDPDLELWRGWDFGFRHPAVVFVQYDPKRDRLAFLHELYPTLNSNDVPGVNTQSLVAMVKDATRRYFPEVTEGKSPVRDFVDPAGNQHKETSDYSSIEIMGQHGIVPEWAVLGRKNRINYARHWVEEGPDRFVVNPHCHLMVKALSAAYRYPEVAKGSVDRDMPDLSKRVQAEPYIHIIDAFEYIVANVLRLDDVEDSTAWSRDEETDARVGELADMYLRASRQPPSNEATSTLEAGLDYQDRRGRIYVSVKGMAEFMREVGWDDPDTVSRLRSTVAQQDQELAALTERVAKLEALEKAVKDLVEPEVVTKVDRRVELRPPTPEEIEGWLEMNPDHPLIKERRAPVQGSIEEWRRLYGKTGPKTKAQKEAEETERRRAVAKAQRKIDQLTGTTAPEPDAEPDGEHDVAAPPRDVELHGSVVNLDDLLDNRVKDVIAFIDGQPTEFQLSVLARESYRAQQAGKDARKMVVDAVNSNIADA